MFPLVLLVELAKAVQSVRGTHASSPCPGLRPIISLS